MQENIFFSKVAWLGLESLPFLDTKKTIVLLEYFELTTLNVIMEKKFRILRKHLDAPDLNYTEKKVSMPPMYNILRKKSSCYQCVINNTTNMMS